MSKNADLPAMPIFDKEGQVACLESQLSGEGYGLTKREQFCGYGDAGVIG